ncbi:purine nucleoside phosphorylase [candidate division TA06 bacterium DG_24]|uniref:Purine nucleoside phosphorylase n=2 Tax=Bacteria division TA06 TaxID=1156500 RepID=A0A0S8JN69_UNCT6|nr:MAG: purine nucleoside phosphorylase [candidate division TA06 bacterium DG_24]KPL10237.1 MAG: purine nucleoside phosphorylase [candidate division TA06 bacterium SM1_40]
MTVRGTEMDDLPERVEETRRFLHDATGFEPQIGVILGTGLGGLAKQIDVEHEISYEEIPNFAVSTVEFHAGKLLFGYVGDRRVMAMHGRFHYYEGYTMHQITLPVRVMRALGASVLVASNASGGLNPRFRTSDIMIMVDHINLLGDNPLIGLSDSRLGPRFLDMSHVYDRELIALAERIALEEGIRLQQGVYVAVPGPNLETAAEYRFLRIIGADVVGMSTVPEAIVAVQSGMRVMGFSVVTDMGLPDALEPTSIETVLEAARRAEPGLTTLMVRIIESMVI